MTDTDQKEMDEVLRRMLNTPPTPHKDQKKTSADDPKRRRLGGRGEPRE